MANREIKTRRSLSSQLEFEVALDAVKGQQRINEIAMKHGVHPNQVALWKQRLIEGGSRLFGRKNGRDPEFEQSLTELDRKIRKTVEETARLKCRVQRATDRATRKALVEKEHPQLSVRKQCALLGVNRNRLESKPSKGRMPKPECPEVLEQIRLAHQNDPTMVARRIRDFLLDNGHEVTRWAVGRMMRSLGIEAKP